MAAYAALVSLMHIIDQIKLHPSPPISLDETQAESLTEKVAFLQKFLEDYSHVGYSKEADALEMRIADGAYAAEDVIESHIVDQIVAGSTNHGEKVSSISFHQHLQKVIEDIDNIKKEVMEIKETTRVKAQLQRSLLATDSSGSSSTGQNITMVGFDDVLTEIMDKLTGQESGCRVIPIVGMGGIGKTTLARNIYARRLIKEYFDICAWATISQEYNTRKILYEVLSQVNKEGRNDMSEDELGVLLHKHLSRRRYLIVIDDIWSIEAWDEVRRFFPENNNGSRIVITTRLSSLASQCSTYVFKMRFLNENEGWNLFSKTVFRGESCPTELERIGRKIVESCRELPLSIAVVGGLLANSKHIQEYWEDILENLNSILSLEDNEHCLKLLHTSYKHLPVHLKPCFLYMGVFTEDRVIRVSTLIKLWVAEGFLKPINGESLEVVAQEYLKELIDRNLILVHKFGLTEGIKWNTGGIKYCNIHDLLRELCIREAQKDRFYNVINKHNSNLPQGISTRCRIVLPQSTSEEEVLDALQFVPLARSLICDIKGVLPLLDFRLLRIFKAFDKDSYHGGHYFLETMLQFVNLRYLDFRVESASKFPSAVCLFWNLQTLIVSGFWGTAPVEIWKMHQLKHVKLNGVYLPHPPSCYVDERDDIVLGNLQTLKKVVDFSWGEEAVKMIPNITQLDILYKTVKGRSHSCLNNLCRLHKLESLRCRSTSSNWDQSEPEFLRNLIFPNSLKKFTLDVEHVHWEDVFEKTGSLPLLEKLILTGGSFKRDMWETVEGQFCSLKFLVIAGCYGLNFWKTESTHFPRLECLTLVAAPELEEVPSEIGEIPTLQSIVLGFCSDSAIISAKRIQEEQEESLGEVSLQVRVVLPYEKEELESLASPNFHIEIDND